MDVYTDYPYTESFPLWSFDDPLAGTPPRPPRVTLAGSLDPATGIFYRSPEHPRLRTAQACEKCRSRKAKVCVSRLILYPLFLFSSILLSLRDPN
ncbi:hypothetical protein DFH06DRAFT_1204600 [Mycena polygramma]|nr:hypothetical protein DFH06DRAFT_1204600 [Mycena polygramma]